MARERFVFVLLCFDGSVGEQVAVGSGELLHDAVLLVICLQNPILVGSELFKLGFEKRMLLTGDSLLVEDEHIRDVIGVNLSLLE